MKQKQKSFKYNSRMIAIGLAIVVFGTAILLSTNIGQKILGVKIHPTMDFANSTKFHHAAKPIKGQYIVMLKSSADSVAEASQLTTKYGGQVKHTYKSAIKGFSANMTENQAMAMSQDPDVQSVEEDGVVKIAGTETNPTWGLDRIDQRNIPLDFSYNYNYNGAGVHAYVLDTGIRTTHVDFGGRAFVAYDNVGGGLNGQDCNGHGTHVAGTIVSNTYGVAKGAQVYSVRVMNCDGTGQISNLLDGVNWITANAIHPAVVNISVAAGGTSPALESGITNSIASGITYAIASGDYGVDACGTTPARTPDAITVSATSVDTTSDPHGTGDYWWAGSGSGSCVDIAAPGLFIDSLWDTSDTAVANKGGTSMAAPHVAGAAALYLQQYPNASPAEVTASILASGTKDALLNVPVGSPNLELYSYITRTAPGDTTKPVANVTSPTSGASVAGTINLTATATDNVGVVGVQFQIDGSNVGSELTTAPYSMSYNAGALNLGSHTVTASARDAAGNVGISPIVTFNVINAGGDTTPPTLSISPSTNTTLKKGNLKFSANASDASGINSIIITMDGAVLKTCYSITTCTVNISANGLTTGPHSVTATAKDNSPAGNTSSKSITITK